MVAERDSWELVAAAQAGDRDAFGELYRRYHAEIFLFAASRATWHTAEDITADVFVAALRDIPRLRDVGVDPAAWLIGIARHKLADHYRGKRSWEHLGEVDERDAPAVPDHGDLIATRDELAGWLARLSVTQQRLIWARFCDAHPPREIATAEATSSLAIRVRVTRAISLLRRIARREAP